MSREQGSGAGDEPIMTEPFDETNGVAGGLDGDSDGTAASDTSSATDRDDDDGRLGISNPDASGQGAADAGLITGRPQ